MPSVQHLIKRVRAAHEHSSCFIPTWYLPVRIDPANTENPYSLSANVSYSDGVVSVKLPSGTEFDGASIPSWWPVAPWVLTLAMHDLYAAWWTWCVTILLMLYTLRLLPWMQKIGRHARGAAVHDRLYRTKSASRAIADAIFLEIMRRDNVPWDIRWQIYIPVRLFGWLAYNKIVVTGGETNQ